MAAITISREFGSEGDTVAENTAQALDYHLVDKRWIGRLLAQYGLVEFDKEYNTLPGFWERFNAQREQRRDLMVSMVNRVVLAVAHHGDVVIVGRSGFAILGPFAEVLHVRIQSPLPVRIERVMAQQEITAAEAEAVVKEGDRVRSAFVASFYGVQWDTASAFDLVINTGKVSPDLAVTWLVEATQALKAGPPAGPTVYESIQVDPILAAAVSDQLKCQTVHR